MLAPDARAPVVPLLAVIVAVGLAACGAPTGPSEPPAPRPEGVPVALRVLSAGVEGEYPVSDADDTGPTLHLVDGDPATTWLPRGVARLEVAAAGLSSIELVHTGVRRLRWRPLLAEGEELRPGPWSEVDLEHAAMVGTGPWQRFTARPEAAVRGVEVEAVDAGAGASIGELRLAGVPAAPDDGVRSTRWVAMASSTPDGPFQRGAHRFDAVDPARCTVWVDGVEHRGTVSSCHVDGEQVTVGVLPPQGETPSVGEPEPIVHQLRIREVGPCFALIDGMPFTRCSPPL
jgi:hypothetical protein